MGSQRVGHDWVTFISVAKSCPTLCNHVDCSCQASLFMGFPRLRILEWVAISFSKGSSWPRDQTCVSCLTDRFFITEPWEAWKAFTTRLKLSKVHISRVIMTPGPLLFSVWCPGQQHWYHPGAWSPSYWLNLHFNTIPSSFVCSLIFRSTHLNRASQTLVSISPARLVQTDCPMFWFTSLSRL